MKKQTVFLIVASIMLATLASATPAEDISKGVLYIVANGYGIASTNKYYPIGGTIQADGSLSFSTNIFFPGEPGDQIVGTVQGRHITFTRTRAGAFVQKYDGWVFEKPYLKLDEMAGTFSHNGVNQYGWYGWVGYPLPR
jgi:hypothetical protein